jgi:hypothetical protein
MAADLLSAVVGDGPMLSCDVHATLYSAAVSRGLHAAAGYFWRPETHQPL